MSIYLFICSHVIISCYWKLNPSTVTWSVCALMERNSFTTQSVLIRIQLQLKLSDLLLQRYSSRSGPASPFLFPCCFPASLCTKTKERGKQALPSLFQGNTDEGWWGILPSLSPFHLSAWAWPKSLWPTDGSCPMSDTLYIQLVYIYIYIYIQYIQREREREREREHGYIFTVYIVCLHLQLCI